MMRALVEPCVPWIGVAGSIADAGRLLATRPIGLAIVDDDTAAEAGPLATVMAGFNATAMSYRTKTVLLWRASDAQDMAPGEIGVDTIIDKPIGGTDLRDRLFPNIGRASCREKVCQYV